MNNLVDSAEHRDVLEKMRAAHVSWEREIRDVGFLPEAEIHSRSAGSTPYEMGRDGSKYDFDSVFAAAQLASSGNAEDIPAIVDLLGDEDSAVRYWAATGLLIHEKDGVSAGREALAGALEDESGSVAIVAAEALARFGPEADREKALEAILARANQAEGDVFEAILANNALDYVDDLAKPYLDRIRELPEKPGKPAPRAEGYVRNLLKKILMDLEG